MLSIVSVFIYFCFFASLLLIYRYIGSNYLVLYSTVGDIMKVTTIDDSDFEEFVSKNRKLEFQTERRFVWCLAGAQSNLRPR
jgi:hypothetical protein